MADLGFNIAAAADITVRVLLALYRYCGDVKAAPLYSSELRDELRVLGAVFENFKSAITLGQNMDAGHLLSVQQALPVFQALLDGLERRIVVEQTKGLNGWKWPFKKEEIRHYIERIE